MVTCRNVQTVSTHFLFININKYFIHCLRSKKRLVPNTSFFHSIVILDVKMNVKIDTSSNIYSALKPIHISSKNVHQSERGVSTDSLTSGVVTIIRQMTFVTWNWVALSNVIRWSERVNCALSEQSSLLRVIIICWNVWC